MQPQHCCVTTGLRCLVRTVLGSPVKYRRVTSHASAQGIRWRVPHSCPSVRAQRLDRELRSKYSVQRCRLCVDQCHIYSAAPPPLEAMVLVFVTLLRMIRRAVLCTLVVWVRPVPLGRVMAMLC